MTDWIGDAFTSDVGWDHLERLVDIGNRMAGSAGERRAAEATYEALESVGARNVGLEEFDLRGWTRGSSAIRAGGTEQECIALPRSPSESVSGELVDLGHGLPGDFEDADIGGAVVLVRSDVPDWYDRYVHRREKYAHAVEGGAAAFVYANHVPGRLPPTGSVASRSDPIGAIPAVGASREVGARLGRRWDGAPVEVEVEADIHDATSANVHAELGPTTDEQVLVTSHVDAHDIAEGAVDNAAGTATVVEIARAIADREADLDRRVHFVAFGAEEVGLVGSRHYADRADRDSVRAVLNSDGVGRARTLEFTTHGFEGLRAAALAVGERFGHPVEIVPEQGPYSDHWPFVRHGVPGYHVSSASDEEGRGWGHTAADTIDKLERRTLRESAILLSDLAVRLAGDGVAVEHRDPSEIAAALEAEGRAEGMKATGDWPF